MSLIDQAAVRLAELQRAGVVLPEPASKHDATDVDIPSEPISLLRKPRHRVTIDLARLKGLGFVTPDAPESAIAREARLMKRPIVRAAREGASRRAANARR